MRISRVIVIADFIIRKNKVAKDRGYKKNSKKEIETKGEKVIQRKI